MSILLAIKHLAKTLKYTNLKGKHGYLFRFNSVPIPASQYLITKVDIATSSSSININSDEWRIIYRLPLIRLASAFNRLKIPYGMLNCIIIPAVFALEQSSQLSSSTAVLICAMSLTTWCTLAISSFFIRNLIGIIYVNDTNDKLKLAYVDYWGKRRDVCIELDDLILEEGKLKQIHNYYQSLRFYSDKKANYKLLHRFGSIEDLATFVSIFGE